jgi:hypothetical protein
MEEPSGIDPKVKKEINEEGYDENGGMLLVGSKEEVEGIRQRREHDLENEGRYENLAAFIKLNKQIAMPYDATDKDSYGNSLKPLLDKGVGSAWLELNGYSIITLAYIDKDKNLIQLKITPKKAAGISSLRFNDDGFYSYNLIKKMEGELKNWGFNFQDTDDSWMVYRHLKNGVNCYQKRVNDAEKAAAGDLKKKEFDF